MYKIAAVTWRDAAFTGRAEMTVDTVPGLVTITSVGYIIVEELDISIALVSDLYEDGSISRAMIIPKNSIVSIRYLRAGKAVKGATDA